MVVKSKNVFSSVEIPNQERYLSYEIRRTFQERNNQRTNRRTRIKTIEKGANDDYLGATGFVASHERAKFVFRLDFLPKTFDSLRTDGGAIIPVSV